MQRINFLLPHKLKVRATNIAKGMDMSLSEFIRVLIEMCCAVESASNGDPFFADSHFYEGDIPDDLSVCHGDYLY